MMNIDALPSFNEGQTGYLELSDFMDSDGNPITPGLITYTVHDLSTKTVLLSGEQLAPGDTFSLELEPHINRIVSKGVPREVHMLTCIVRYGIGKFITKELPFAVVDLAFHDVSKEG